MLKSIFGAASQFTLPKMIFTSEDKIYQRNNSDCEQAAVEEEEEKIVYKSDEQVKASGLGKATPTIYKNN